jgi:hypothetical protein
MHTLTGSPDSPHQLSVGKIEFQNQTLTWAEMFDQVNPNALAFTVDHGSTVFCCFAHKCPVQRQDHACPD